MTPKVHRIPACYSRFAPSAKHIIHHDRPSRCSSPCRHRLPHLPDPAGIPADAPRLPLFHSLLQDESLASNIGWDLAHMVLPMLPQSRECLNDVARLGNPREVILGVCDALMNLVPQLTEEYIHHFHKGEEKKLSHIMPKIRESSSCPRIIQVLSYHFLQLAMGANGVKKRAKKIHHYYSIREI